MVFRFAANALCKWPFGSEVIRVNNLDRWTIGASAVFVYSILITLLFYQLDYTICTQRKIKSPALVCTSLGEQLKRLIAH